MSNFSLALKRWIAERAAFRCEYCLVAEADSNFDYHIEHIISRQHGGSDHSDNLAFACARCNWKKGSNIATLLQMDGPLIPLFNPRKSNWFDHFEIDNGLIVPKTAIGEATIKLLELNALDNIIERRELAEAGNYP